MTRVPLVEIATTGHAALDLVARFHPDVVILDLRLPDLDGIEVLHGIRGWNRVPVVVLSARATSDDKVTTSSFEIDLATGIVTLGGPGYEKETHLAWLPTGRMSRGNNCAQSKVGPAVRVRLIS